MNRPTRAHAMALTPLFNRKLKAGTAEPGRWTCEYWNNGRCVKKVRRVVAFERGVGYTAMPPFPSLTVSGGEVEVFFYDQFSLLIAAFSKEYRSGARIRIDPPQPLIRIGTLIGWSRAESAKATQRKADR